MSRLTNCATISAFVAGFRNLLASWSVELFLLSGGAGLVSLGVAGVTGLLGSFSPARLLHPPHWIHWFHLAFGLFVLLSALSGIRKLQLGLALLAAIAGTALGTGDFALSIYGFVRDHADHLPDFSDPLAHLAVGTLAICALRNRAGREALE